MSTVTIIGEIALPVRFETSCRFACRTVLYCLVEFHPLTFHSAYSLSYSAPPELELLEPFIWWPT